MIKDLIKKMMLSRGMILSHPPGQFDAMEFKFTSAKKRGLDLKCIVDGGAAEGTFARHIKSIFPSAAIVCIEPREDAQQDLQQVARDLPNVHVAQTLVGPREGSVTFNESDTQSSVLPNSRGESFGQTRTVAMTTLDALIDKLKVAPPDLIKLDLQGYELDALRGAEECMKRAQMLMLELSFLPFQRGAPMAAEVIDFVGQRGFCIYDIPALWVRPLDGALAQGDFIFIKRDHPLRKDGRWSMESEFA